jgi:hypothetical protein
MSFWPGAPNAYGRQMRVRRPVAVPPLMDLTRNYSRRSREMHATAEIVIGTVLERSVEHEEAGARREALPRRR